MVSGFCKVGRTHLADLTREAIDTQKSEVVASGAELSMAVRSLKQLNKRDSNMSVAGEHIELYRTEGTYQGQAHSHPSDDAGLDS